MPDQVAGGFLGHVPGDEQLLLFRVDNAQVELLRACPTLREHIVLLGLPLRLAQRRRLLALQMLLGASLARVGVISLSDAVLTNEPRNKLARVVIELLNQICHSILLRNATCLLHVVFHDMLDALVVEYVRSRYHPVGKNVAWADFVLGRPADIELHFQANTSVHD